MEQEAFLIGFAQLSLVLTGFVSVFVAFFMGNEESSRPIVPHAASMLAGSLLSVITALAPIVVYFYRLDGEPLWFWSTVIGAVTGTVYSTCMMILTLRLNWTEFKEAGVLHLASPYGLGSATFILFALNLFGTSGPGRYILGSLLMFMIAVIGFVTFSIHKVLTW